MGRALANVPELSYLKAMDTPRPASVPLATDVVSDVVCPGCHPCKHRLECALALVPEVDATVAWSITDSPTITSGSY